MRYTDEFKIDFVGIGAPKCGTTWLAHLLEQHPSIDFSKDKEPYFFSGRAYLKNVSEQTYVNAKRPRSLTSYKKLFKNTGGKRGEYSVLYMFEPEALQRIYAQNPEVKILICLRHPVDATYSKYWYDNKYRRDFPGTVQDYEQQLKHDPEYLGRYRYAPHLRHVFTVFPKENVKLLLLDELQANPKAVYEDVCAFLSLPPHSYESLDTDPVNENFKINNHVFASLANLTARALRSFHMHAVLQWLSQPYSKLNTQNFKYPKLTVAEKKKYLAYFDTDIQELETNFHLNVQPWRRLK